MAVALMMSLALIAAVPMPQSATSDSTASAFNDALEAIGDARFDTFFARDVTVFFPDEPFPNGRVEGRAAVLSAFHSVFGRVKARCRTALNIAPLDQRIEH